MAKKKRKHFIKLNNKIRTLFQGEPFDEAVTKLDYNLLLQLAMLVEDNCKELQREDLIRLLRRVWSEGEYTYRKVIVDYLLSVQKSKNRKLNKDKEKEILKLLDDIELTTQEKNILIEEFLEYSSLITKEKLLNKLQYIRLKNKIGNIESITGVHINSLNQIEFIHTFNFHFPDSLVKKDLLVTGKEIDTKLFENENKAKEYINTLKIKAVEQKEQEIKEFVENIKNNRYISYKIVQKAIEDMPIDSKLYQIPLEFDTVESIIKSIDKSLYLSQSSDHYIIHSQEFYDIANKSVEYLISLSYEKQKIYNTIWSNSDFTIISDKEAQKKELEKRFKSDLEQLYQRVLEQAKELDIPDNEIAKFINDFLIPQLQASKNLKIKEKTKKRIFYHFFEYIRPLKEKKLKEDLLAKSIRDFKLLFPTARRLKRKIIFHAGPTNSGKTYQAMQRLKSADTGYYLAPLRLLALEGYENLKKSGVATSLITGEEEIIDEDSTHISSTIEMLNSEVEVDVCVIDEIQMIADRDRGWAWANALIGAPAKEVIVTGSSDAIEAIKEVCEYLDEELEIKEFTRMNPLKVLPKPTPVKKIKKGSAVVAFSRKEVLKLKQQLSKEYKVSVVYGNLSPEVRREEASRFREGKSDILVATDAIAMGLNLPIKEILFARADKFDGLKSRELTPAEVLQIAGRAGRYGIYEDGYVGALDAHTLKVIESKFNTPLPDIKLPFSVMASLEHVILIGEIIQSDKLLEILEFFAQNMEFEGPFEAANIDSMLEVAKVVDDYDLDLKSRYFLACAPVSINSPYLESVFHRYLKQMQKSEKVRYIPPRSLPKYAHTNEELLNAEDRVKEVSLYLWLSFKFKEQFLDTELAKNSRDMLNQFIERSLKRGNFVKQCRKCGKMLDFSYKFSICDNCFKRSRANSKRGERDKYKK